MIFHHPTFLYFDNTSFVGQKTTVFYPKKDVDGNPLSTEFGLCTYKDHQTVAVQEMPENSPPGLLPSSMDVILDDDLVDTCKPGDRVQIVGVYRALAPYGSFASGNYKTVIIANNVVKIGREARTSRPLTKQDVSEITKIGARKDVFELLSASLSPSIYGHEYVARCVIANEITNSLL